jgi:protein TonB
MSTSTLPWPARARSDSPWRRLHWTLPLALLICAVTFSLFAYSMWRPVLHSPDPAPVTAELVELPAPAQPQTRQSVIVPPRAKPAEQAIPEPPVQPSATTPPPSTPVTAPPPPAPASENHGAQALIRPLPVIPDELREEAMNEAATVRFTIAVDGSAAVELVKPTQNPRLNRLLLDTLKTWRFMPAIKDGQPAPSVEVMIIRLHVD